MPRMPCFWSHDLTCFRLRRSPVLDWDYNSTMTRFPDYSSIAAIYSLFLYGQAIYLVAVLGSRFLDPMYPGYIHIFKANSKKILSEIIFKLWSLKTKWSLLSKENVVFEAKTPTFSACGRQLNIATGTNKSGVRQHIRYFELGDFLWYLLILVKTSATIYKSKFVEGFCTKSWYSCSKSSQTLKKIKRKEWKWWGEPSASFIQITFRFNVIKCLNVPCG